MVPLAPQLDKAMLYKTYDVLLGYWLVVWAAKLASPCAFDVVSIFSYATSIPHAKLITNERRIEITFG